MCSLSPLVAVTSQVIKLTYYLAAGFGNVTMLFIIFRIIYTLNAFKDLERDRDTLRELLHEYERQIIEENYRN